MIRYAKLSDAKAIADIYNEYILHSVATFETEAVSEDEMYRRIADISSRFPYLVFEEGGQVIGYAYAHLWQERAAYCHTWETPVYVSSSSARQGIGRLIACITHGNEASYALHRKLGFEQVAFFEKVGTKFGKRLDVTDWELILRP